MFSKPVPKGSVADLVVILSADDESRRLHAGRIGSVCAVAKLRILAGVDEAALVATFEIADAVEVLIDSGALSGQGDMKRMVQVVAPLRVEAPASEIPRTQCPGIVEIALSD